MSSKLAVVILAAGQGTRMKSRLPKVLHPVAGRSMIAHVVAAAGDLKPDRIVVVVGPGHEAVREAVAPHDSVVQEERLGTAHALATARPLLEGFDGDVLVLYGDCPLIRGETLARMTAAARAEPRPGGVVLAFRKAPPHEYGRLVLAADGRVERIVEHRDADEAERAIELCNSGVMLADAARLWDWVGRIGNNNAKGEYYLTDLVGLATADGLPCVHVEGAAEELLGANSRAELAEVERALQRRLRAAAMDAGVTMTDPESVWLSWDTRLGRDVTIGPNVYFGPGVSVGDNVAIRPFCHLEGTDVADDAVVGPFARLRPGAVIGAAARVGNFVEVKKATIEDGAKVNHLSYVGDARVGAGANVGAGTITCNYDGFSKAFTDIGDNAFVGSNTALVAPVKIGDGAIVAAGSVITKDVAADALAVGRASQMELAGWADRFRERHRRRDKGAGEGTNGKDGG